MINNFEPYKHYNKEIEKVIIGTILLEKLAFSRICDVLDDKDIFYLESHKEIYFGIREMYKQSLPIDLMTVCDFFWNKMNLKTLEGSEIAYYLTTCMNGVCSSAHLEYHALILRECWKKRKIIEIKYSSLQDDGDDPKQNIIDINNALNKLLETNYSKDWYDMSELILELYKHQDDMKLSGGIGTLSGFSKIDNDNGGFFGGQMIFIGARPSVGKSALANTIAINIANIGKKVGILSLEMSNVEIAARLAAIDTDTDYSIIYRGLMQDEYEVKRMYEKITNKTVGLPIFVSDKTDVNVFDIRAKAERLMQKEGLDILIIDYLQLIGTSDSKNSNRENEVAKISRAIKILAKDLKIPVIVLGQLNREVTKRKGAERYPILGDIRESGAIEQDSDIVMFLHSDFMSGHLQDEYGNSTEGKSDLVIRKWRNGKNNFIIPLDFIAPKMKFLESGTQGYSNIAQTSWIEPKNDDDISF
jgi:replicative DNA helicase